MEVVATIQRERAAKFDFHTGVDQLTVHNFNIVSLHIDAFLSGQRLVLGHWGLALSYASYYAAFAWARCRYVNGQVVSVDGGLETLRTTWRT